MAGQRSLGGMLHTLLIVVGGLALILLLQAGFIFVMFGMLPSVVAYFVDTAPGKPIYKCVLTCNFAGMLPSFAEAMMTGSISATLQEMMLDPFVWFLVYGSAAGGYALIIVCRTLTLASMTISSQTRVEQLKKQQENLIEEWGPRVKHWQV